MSNHGQSQETAHNPCGLYILEDGIPVPEPDVLKWAAWIENSNRHIAKDIVLDKVKISTVFTGLDSGIMTEHPVLYETMVFGGQHDEYQRRYQTAEEARIGHRETVEMVLGEQT